MDNGILPIDMTTDQLRAADAEAQKNGHWMDTHDMGPVLMSYDTRYYDELCRRDRLARAHENHCILTGEGLY